MKEREKTAVDAAASQIAEMVAPVAAIDPKKLSDNELYNLSRQYGANALMWRRKFAGLLPEINNRRLYEKKGFGSIFEFAKKLAGMSEEQVRLTLNLEKRFEDKPVLQSLLVNGEVSVNKLARIVSVATVENQEILADKIQLRPQKAVETLARDIKNENACADPMCEQPDPASENEYHNGSQKPLFEDKSLRAQIKPQPNIDIVKLRLDDDVLHNILELQEMGIDINQLMREMLQKREQELADEEEKLSAEAKPTNSRYIPKKIKNFIAKKYGTKCSIKGCNRLAKEIHHGQRFKLAGMHDVKYMAPLCEEHHKIAQTIDIKYVQVKMAATKCLNVAVRTTTSVGMLPPGCS